MTDYPTVKSSFEKLWRLLSHEKTDISRIYLFAILAGVINLSLPLGIQAIINFIQTGLITTSWIILVAFVLAGLVLAGFFQLLQMYIIDKMSQRLFAHAAFEFAWKLPRLRLDDIDQIHIPERVNRFFDVLTLQKGLSKLLMDFSAAVLQVTLGLILLSLYHPLFIGFSLFVVVFMAAVYRITIPGGLRTNYRESSYKYQMVYWLEELAESMLTFKMAGTTNLHLEKTDQHVKGYLEARHQHFLVLARQYGFSVLLKFLIAGGLLIAGSLLVLEGQMNLGQFVAAEIIILLISSSVDKLITGLETVYDVLTAVEKIDEMAGLETEPDEGEPPGVRYEKPGVSISFDDVAFSYPGTRDALLSSLKFEVPAGKSLVIASDRAEESTALLHLAASSFNSYSGIIRIDGRNLREMNPAQLRTETGSFLNADYIFHGSVSENISIGRPHISREKIEEAARKTGALEWVSAQPKGFDTLLIPDGHQVPVHVKTKLLLARAIACSPRLMLVDLHQKELTPEEYQSLASVLEQTIKNGTTLITACRSKAIANFADEIIRLEFGHITFTGTPQTAEKEDWYATVFHS